MSSTHPSSSGWEPPLPEDLQRMLPQYEITGIIGRGGMGAVYRGRQAKLNRTVAIKLLPETFTQGPDELNFAKRFEQEAQAMAGLDHPAIISVYDFGETPNGQLYFVMEFIDGMDIHQYLKAHGGRLPQEHALSITAHVLDALDYAHAHGIVHRDIKPANILLNREGRVKIADFGLAKKFGEHADESAPALTMSNVAVGTPDFVAPEALDSEAKPDHRADLYAVGVMLYQMLTGKLPRGNYQSPSEMQPEIDPRLDDIVEKAMAANPDHRYASAAAVRADLDRILSQPLARVEAGEDSEAVPMAVPVTDTVKAGGKAAAAARRGPTGQTKPSRPDPTPAKGGNTGLIVGLSVAAAVAAGLGLFWLLGPKFGDAGKGAPPTASPSSVPKNDPPPTGTAGASPAPEPPKPMPAPPPSTPPVTVAKSDPPASPVPAPTPTPMPAPVAASVSERTPAAVPTPSPATPASPPTPTPAPDPTVARLAALPGLKTRLDGYLAARTKQIGELAAKYRGGLQTRLDQAANAGDLKLATAYQAETARVEALQQAIATPPADALSAATDATTTALPALPEGSLEPLVALRQTWTTESDKIRTTLDAALRQSLQALESELTKAREFENAQAVVAYREAVGKSASGTPIATATPVPGPATPTTSPSAPTPLPAKAGPKDLTLVLATKEKPYENSLGMKFVPVPDTDVLFSIHETRYKDYQAYAKENPGIDKRWENQTIEGVALTERAEDHPVVNMSWDDAQAFCAWLTKKDGKTYRLPTDREWSIAVGIGRDERWKADTTPATVDKPLDQFPWGKGWPPPKGAGNYADKSYGATGSPGRGVIPNYDDGFPTTAPVMSYEANKLGIFDLGGNVQEWVEDWYSEEKKEKLKRGGRWGSVLLSDLASSLRDHGGPSMRGHFHGFRIVVEIASRPVAPAPTLPTATPSPPSVTRPLSLPDPALARATKDAPFANTLGMKFVPVPGTDVLFCIHETRHKDYAEYARSNTGIDPRWFTQTQDGFAITDRPEDHPVVRVSWEDAQAFCSWLSKREGKTYRLPTDREWSLAAGIGREEDWKVDTTPVTVFQVPDAFPWGDEWPPPKGAGNYSDESRRAKIPRDDAKYLNGYDDGFPTTAPVMSFKANKLGLFDLGGNVWEWCEDWYSVEQKERVLRGSSWDRGYDRGVMLSSYRPRLAPDLSYYSGGFRVVLVGSASSGPAAVAGRTEAGLPGALPPATGATPPQASGAPAAKPDPALARATKDAPFENSLGMKFVPVPDTGILLCIHETRKGDYAKFAAEDPSVNAGWKNAERLGVPVSVSDDHPVVNVNWTAAAAFCSWLSQKENRTYRLPTDREWSVAVGIGREEKEGGTPESLNGKLARQYPWGTEWPPPKGTGNYADTSTRAKLSGATLEGYTDGFPTTAPAMSFKKNRLGIYDLSGNVWEWCDDWWNADQKQKFRRGGGWDHAWENFLNISCRDVWDLNNGQPNTGFRCALVIAPGNAAPAATPDGAK